MSLKAGARSAPTGSARARDNYTIPSAPAAHGWSSLLHLPCGRWGTDGTLWPVRLHVDAARATLMNRRGVQESWRGAQHMASSPTCVSPALCRAAPRCQNTCLLYTSPSPRD
eukprot:1154892-Alexandrium_andersonii.AAC.1